ncbi:MAG: septum formation family protein [Sporichthyaceae bacterium]
MSTLPSYPPHTAEPWAYPQQPQKGSNGYAVTSLIFGIIGGILLAVPFGIAGLRRAKTAGTGKGMSIAGLILSGVWALIFGGLVAIGAYAGGTSALDVKAGDCVRELPSGSRVITMSVVDCDQPHLAEVYAVLEMPSGAFPGGAAVETFSQKCDPALENYAPKAHADEAVGIYTLYPTRTSWSLGDRVVTCIATLETAQTGSIVQWKGTSTKTERPAETSVIDA